MTNKLCLLQTMFNLRTNRKKVMGGDVWFLRSQFSRLHAMGTALEEPLKVALLISSLSNLSEFQLITASINALPQHTTTWNYVTTLSIEVDKRMIQGKDNNSKEMVDGADIISSSTSGENRVQRISFKSSGNKCYNCRKQGPVSRNCLSPMRGRPDINREVLIQARTRRVENYQGNIMACFAKEDNASWLSIAGLNDTNSNEKTFVTIDSGATEHAVNNLKYFEGYQKIEEVQPTRADGSKLMLTHKGKVTVEVGTPLKLL